MNLRIKLSNSTVNFPSEFGSKKRTPFANALIGAVLGNVLNIAANLEIGFADLKLTANLRLGTEFRDIKFREIEWMDFDKPFGKQFKGRQLKVKAFDAELKLGGLNLNAELDFNR